MDAIRENDLEADVIFACGPKPMLRAIKAYALEKDPLLGFHGRAHGLWNRCLPWLCMPVHRNGCPFSCTQ